MLEAVGGAEPPDFGLVCADARLCGLSAVRDSSPQGRLPEPPPPPNQPGLKEVAVCQPDLPDDARDAERDAAYAAGPAYFNHVNPLVVLADGARNPPAWPGASQSGGSPQDAEDLGGAREKFWAELGPADRAAAAKIGWGQASWDDGALGPFQTQWEDLPPDMLAAAQLLGFDQVNWDEVSERSTSRSRSSAIDQVEGPHGYGFGDFDAVVTDAWLAQARRTASVKQAASLSPASGATAQLADERTQPVLALMASSEHSELRQERDSDDAALRVVFDAVYPYRVLAGEIAMLKKAELVTLLRHSPSLAVELDLASGTGSPLAAFDRVFAAMKADGDEPITSIEFCAYVKMHKYRARRRDSMHGTETSWPYTNAELALVPGFAPKDPLSQVSRTLSRFLRSPAPPSAADATTHGCSSPSLSAGG
jgi:hypothetical protein